MSTEQLPLKPWNLSSSGNRTATRPAWPDLTGDFCVARVPARLDVMGGIADYSGANVCEAVLVRGMLVALQPRTDRTLRIRTMQIGKRSLPMRTRIPLDYFTTGDGLSGYNDFSELCHSNPLAVLASYIGGSIFACWRGVGETHLRLQSAAVERRAHGVTGLAVPRQWKSEPVLSQCLSEIEPGGRTDCTAGPDGGKPCGRRALRNMEDRHKRPAPAANPYSMPTGSGHGRSKDPSGCGFVGVNSMVRHSVAANPYSDVRIGALVGKRIIN